MTNNRENNALVTDNTTSSVRNLGEIDIEKKKTLLPHTHIKKTGRVIL